MGVPQCRQRQVGCATEFGVLYFDNSLTELSAPAEGTPAPNPGTLVFGFRADAASLAFDVVTGEQWLLELDNWMRFIFIFLTGNGLRTVTFDHFYRSILDDCRQR